MAAQISAANRLGKTRETPATGNKRSILAIHTRQAVNSELHLSFLPPVHLARSSAAKDVFQQDASQGSLPARHSTVSLLGDARAGKTSLEKHLLNQSFDPAEEATKGLEFDVVQTDVTEVGEGWQAVQEGPYSRYNTGRAQYVALQILREIRSVVDPPKFLGPAAIALLNHALAMVVITMTSLSVGFQLGFGVSLLSKIGMFKLFGQSYYASASYGIDLSLIHLMIDLSSRHGLFRKAFFAFGDEQTLGYPYLQYVMFVVVIVMFSFVGVLPSPIGGNNCVALAFCLMCAPAQLHSDQLASHFQFNAGVSHNNCLLATAIFVGVLTVSSSMRRHLVSTLFVLLITALGITKTADNESQRLDYMLSLIGGFAAGAIAYSTSEFVKRLCNFNRRGLQIEVLIGPIGFVYGIGLSWLYGWQIVLPSTWKCGYYVVPNIVAMFLIIQVERQRVYWASHEVESYPAILVGRSIRTFKHVNDLPFKLTLIDFAGDAVYHCTHHLFLSNLSIDLIVFNMERLEREPDYIRRVCYWVQSVIVHVQNPNPHIFIVGTHAHSLTIDRRKELSQNLSRVLLSNETFTQSIVEKPGSKKDVVFCVENSIPIQKDAQARLLRKTIMEVASSSFQSKRHIPIKWLKVSDFVSKYKSGSTDTCLLDKRTLFDKLRQEGVTEAEEGREEFEEMLKFYDEIGEIKVMGDVVVLNLKALVQLVVELVEFDCDDHDVGIVHVSSLRRVWKFLTAENFLSAIELFERFDILCPISQEQYLVPLLLETREETQAKEVETGRGVFWSTAESDTILYFKFYKFHPEAIFLRLLARCLSRSQETHDLGRGADRDVYRNVGRFYQGHDFYYKAELVCQSVQQNMIQVTVKCAPNRGPHSLLSRLHKDLQQIRDRDFPYLNYTVGLPCPACSSSNNHEGESSFAPSHILRVSGHDEELPRPGQKVTLMCRGKAFDVDLGQHQSTLDVAQTMKPDGSSKTLELRSGHGLLDTKTIQHLSILLDPPAPIFGNNWRMLADELGLCFQDISYIESKHNPTEMVLDMYATNTQTPTVQQVHRALIDIDRPDAAGLLEAIVEQKPSDE